MKTTREESPASYSVAPPLAPDKEGDDVIRHALTILASRLARPGRDFSSAQDVKAYCQLHLGGLEHEEFGVLFLDVSNRLIAFRSMFRGTLSQASVYPREVAKEALRFNASAVILTHNHPSGRTEPSRADEHLTSALKTALALIDVRVLDHVVVSAHGSTSFAERGLL